ncbi:MAG: CoA pyrophosphatase [Micrococcales bacterium]|nr:CoA pyrophosphatase [Micrococcales bacterium]
MLFGPDEAGRDSVVLTQRSQRLRSHAGQVAFPGGRLDPHDDGPVDEALREANEEIGIERAEVEVVGLLPELFVPVSKSVVTTVLGWAPTPMRLWARSVDEVESVARVPLTQLVDPAHRIVATHPAGYRSPAFELPDLYVWGFTAFLLDRVLQLSGLELAWDRHRERSLPERFGRPLSRDHRLPSESTSGPAEPTVQAASGSAEPLAQSPAKAWEMLR